MCTVTVHEIGLVLKQREGKHHGLKIVKLPYCLWQKTLSKLYVSFHFLVKELFSCQLFILMIPGFIVPRYYSLYICGCTLCTHVYVHIRGSQLRGHRSHRAQCDCPSPCRPRKSHTVFVWSSWNCAVRDATMLVV